MNPIPAHFLIHRYRTTATRNLYMKQKGFTQIDDEKDFQQWLGRSLGYPECCVIFFTTCWINRPYGDNPYRARIDKNRKAIRIGYVPCPSCMLKIEAGEQINFGPRTITIKI
jgi:hypothetical protein